MIANKSRDTRRSKLLKMPKNIQRLYKEGKCNECSVLVTRMNFAKILGKFTKVKIQYASGSNTRSTRTTTNTPTSPPNSRLKSNENGMVLLHRNAYSQHPVKSSTTKKAKTNTTLKENTPQREKNVLRESNKVKKIPVKEKNANNNKTLINRNFKQYGIVFINPKSKNNDFKNKLSLTDLLPYISMDILPSEQWCIDYFPKDSEPKDDKVYDRIAAELEDLMYDDNKPEAKSYPKPNSAESKTDDFPSIMDILNDNTTSLSQKEGQSISIEPKPSLESNDVEAMLLGKTSEKIEEPKPIEVDPSDVTNLLADVAQLTEAQMGESKLPNAGEIMDLDNPNSPSILEEVADKGNNEGIQSLNDNKAEKTDTTNLSPPVLKDQNSSLTKENNKLLIPDNVTHVIFRKSINGKCEKSVTCPKNLKYSVELEGKSVDFLGAPKFISSIEDLEVLLQIVNESKLNNLYVLH